MLTNCCKRFSKTAGRCAVVAAIMVLCLAVMPAAGQSDLSFGPALSAPSMMARQLVLMSRKALAGNAQPTDKQLTAAAMLLDAAAEYDPRDAEIWRLDRELANRMGDRKAEIKALSQYTALVPSDDAAQLDLIMLLLENQQTVEARLTQVERILDAPNANSFSAALRSRLASYVAQGALELGDRSRFAKRLRQAAQLDASNRQAMRMIYELVEARDGSPAELGVAVVGMLRADPMDVSVRRKLADLLASLAAYEAATVQYQAAQDIAQAPLDDGFYHDWVVALLAAGKNDDALSLLSALEARRRQAMAQPAGEAPGLAPAPDNATEDANTPKPTRSADGNPAPVAQEENAASAGLPLDLELLRALAFRARHEAAGLKASLARVRQSLAQREKAGDAAALADAVWLDLLLGEVPTEDLAKLAAAPPMDAALWNRIQGWAALRQDQPDRARELLSPLAASGGDPFAAYGLLRLDNLADSALQGRRLNEVIAQAPRSTAAILASQDRGNIAQGSPPVESPAAAALVTALNRVPLSIRQPDLQNRNWLRLDLRMTVSSYRYLQPVTLTVTLSNTTEAPLAIRSDGPIRPGLLIYMQPKTIMQRLGNLPAVVNDAARRLVIAPREKLTFDVPLDRSELGWLLAINPADTIIFGGNAILGGQPTPDGQIALGPMTLTATLPQAQRIGTQLTKENIQTQIAGLGDPNPSVVMQSMAWLLQMTPRLTGPATQEIADQAVEAVTARYLKADALQQAWAVRFLTPDTTGKQSFPRIHEQALRSEEPIVWMMYLATQTQAAGGDAANGVAGDGGLAINAALRQPNAKIVSFAEAWQGVLEVLTQLQAAPQPAP